MRRQVDKQRFRNSKQQLHQHLGTSEIQTVNPEVPGLLAGRDCDTMGQAGSKPPYYPAACLLAARQL